MYKSLLKCHMLRKYNINILFSLFRDTQYRCDVGAIRRVLQRPCCPRIKDKNSSYCMVDMDMCSLAHKTLEETVAGKTKKT